MTDKIQIELPIIVEGKYDKIKLDSIFDATVIPCDGFRIFNSKEKRALLRVLAEKSSIILLADSDHAGMMIRSHISGIIPKDKIINLYTPQIKGKEKRKDKPSKEGYVGVEGVEADTLRKLLLPYSKKAVQSHKDPITKTDLYVLGLSGCADAAQKRSRICTHFSLPEDISANAMLAALNIITSRNELYDICNYPAETVECGTDSISK